MSYIELPDYDKMQLAIEVTASFVMLVATLSALIYILVSEERAKSISLILIFISLIVAFSAQSILSIFDLLKLRGHEELGIKENTIGNLLYASQFFFQWLSLIIFNLEYL